MDNKYIILDSIIFYKKLVNLKIHLLVLMTLKIMHNSDEDILLHLIFLISLKK
jgi:hypothetical protein